MSMMMILPKATDSDHALLMVYDKIWKQWKRGFLSEDDVAGLLEELHEIVMDHNRIYTHDKAAK